MAAPLLGAAFCRGATAVRVYAVREATLSHGRAATPLAGRAILVTLFAGVAAAADLGLVVKVVHSVTGFIAVALIAGTGAARATDDFPLTGNYTQNVPCKGDGSDPRDARLKISPHEIDSHVGVCTFLDTERKGSSIDAHVECRFPGGPLMGEVTFTMRSDKTVDFTDSDKNYHAVLYRCPK